MGITSRLWQTNQDIIIGTDIYLKIAESMWKDYWETEGRVKAKWARKDKIILV